MKSVILAGMLLLFSTVAYADYFDDGNDTVATFDFGTYSVSVVNCYRVWRMDAESNLDYDNGTYWYFLLCDGDYKYTGDDTRHVPAPTGKYIPQVVAATPTQFGALVDGTCILVDFELNVSVQSGPYTITEDVWEFNCDTVFNSGGFE